MSVLCLSEVVRYRTKRVENHLMVDTSQGDREESTPGRRCDRNMVPQTARRGSFVSEGANSVTLSRTLPLQVLVSLDMDFPGLKCSDGDLRVEDSKGVVYDDARIHVNKYPLDEHGEATEEDKSVGCRLVGTLAIKRVAGNFHISPAHRHAPQVRVRGRCKRVARGVLSLSNTLQSMVQRSFITHALIRIIAPRLLARRWWAASCSPASRAARTSSTRRT